MELAGNGRDRYAQLLPLRLTYWLAGERLRGPLAWLTPAVNAHRARDLAESVWLNLSPRPRRFGSEPARSVVVITASVPSPGPGVGHTDGNRRVLERGAARAPDRVGVSSDAEKEPRLSQRDKANDQRVFHQVLALLVLQKTLDCRH